MVMFRYGLSLALLEARVFLVDHIQHSLAANDLAINASFLNGRSNFHLFCFFDRITSRILRPLYDWGSQLPYYLYLKMILPRERSYGLISTPTLSPGRILI